jgi:hypothetical protein
MFSSPIFIYIIMGAMFAFVVIWAIYQGFVWNQVHRSGVIVEGRVSEHQQIMRMRGSSLYRFYLTYTYEYQGKTFAKVKRVNEKTYLAYPDDTKIRVRCMSSNPSKAAIVDF